VKEKPSSVDLNFSNHTCGDCFKPYKECFSLQTVLSGASIPVGRKFDVNFFLEVSRKKSVFDVHLM